MEEIPGPRAWPILGNMLDVRSEEGPLKAFENLADIYGPIYQLTLAGQKVIHVSSAELMKQLVDEKQFLKTPPIALDARKGARPLFTARSNDPDWGQAHRILTPAFGVLPVEGMFDEMKDIASQMCLKWARMGEGTQVLLTDDFTRLTLDTIALCAMDFRFNSFYQDDMHPFVAAMTGVLSISGKRSKMPRIYTKLMGGSDEAKFREDSATLNRTAQEIIDHRRANPSQRKDLLNTMIHGTDPKTREPMRDELIGANMVGFLVAGHETTSGLLSFVFMQLLRHPKAYLKAQQEVDAVLGNGGIEAKNLQKLPYLKAVLRETLRLTPTAPAITKKIHPDRRHEAVTLCDGKYLIDPDAPVRVLLGKAMSDPTYFGEDAHEFNPDRMIDTNPDFDHFMKAWKPFGNGSRSCIGQNFAWQEALLVCALVLQNFDMGFVDAGYQVRVKQALTVKPADLYVKVKLRKDVSPNVLIKRLYGSGDAGGVIAGAEDRTPLGTASNGQGQVGLTVLYGSNSGTCYSLAQRLASTVATKLGVETCVRDLDFGVDALPRDHPLVIVTASYEGQPPDNAARFVEWLESSQSQSFRGVKYSVFGCGHKDWRETLHRIPKLIDKTLEERGAKRIYNFGAADVSLGNILDDFGLWQDGLLSVLEDFTGTSVQTDRADPANLADIHTDVRATRLSSGLSVCKVKDVKVLTAAGQPEKRHMEIELPTDSSYECGDYLAVLPVQPDELVKRVMAHWELPWDATMVLKSKAFAPLPDDTVLSIYDVLKGYYELAQQASKKDLRELKKCTDDASMLAELERQINDDGRFEAQIVVNNLSLFEYLVKHPQIKMPFATFLSCLMPLRVRQYSISSSPMVHPTSCTITYSVFRSSIAGSGEPFEGASTSFLSKLKPGDSIHTALKRTATAKSACPFHLPADNTTPILMFCAGTGLAPFRGFIQQRAFMLEANSNLRLAPAILFVGCRSATEDRLYAEELDEWSARGAVDVRYAFSGDAEKSFGCRHVDERMLRDREDVVQAWKSGARVYVCGGRAVLEAVGRATREILESGLRHATEAEKQELKGRFDRARAARVVVDVFD